MDLKKQTIVELKDIHNITLIMFGLLGDVFIRTPILKALKELYPDAKITAVVDAVGVLVVQRNPYCDDIIVAKRSKESKLDYYLNKIKIVSDIRKSHPDLIIDLYNGGSSPLTVFLSGAKYRLGYAHQKDKQFYNLKSEYIPYSNGVIDSYNKQIVSILQVISERIFSIKPIYKISDHAKETMKSYLESINVDFSKIYTLNLGSGGEEKLLNNKLYFELIKYIYEKYGFAPAIVKNPGQEYLQENLIFEHLSPTSTIPFVELKALSIDEVAVVIDMTQFIITPDTGLMHLAFALDTFVLTAFTYTNPKLVDIGSEKFIPVFQSFEDMQIHQTQNITFELMRDGAERVFEKLNS
jgi:lipopolysaccharide heptosyltransferase III